MTIHQISVFIQNQAGSVIEVLTALKDEGIQLIASTIADTQEYGIYRIICSEPSRALGVLKKAGLSAQMIDVFAVQLDNRPGCAADALKVLSDNGVSLNYMYSFLLGGKGILIFRTNDTEKARELMCLNRLSFLNEEKLNELN